MEFSKIEWTDHTFNPWTGCTKVSPGCANCYAEARDLRWNKGAHWGKGAPRQRTTPANWRQPHKWNAAALAAGTRARVFCASLADWLDDEVEIAWLADLLQLIHDTPQLDWLLLSKRPQNWRARLEAALAHMTTTREGGYTVPAMGGVFLWLQGTAHPNVWIGTTVEDQARADLRIPALLQIPAVVRFLSCEPLLELVNIRGYLMGFESKNPGHCGNCGLTHGFTRCPNYGGISKESEDCSSFRRVDFAIHWVICGGESGPKARPMHPAWARALREQCRRASVPFFFKQWGDWKPASELRHPHETAQLYSAARKECCGAPRCLAPTRVVSSDQEGSFPLDMYRLGKKAAGRELDGRTWDEFPQPVEAAPAA